MNLERMACLYFLRCANQEGVSHDRVLSDLELPEDFFENASDQRIADTIPKLVSCLARLTRNELFAFNAGRNIHPCFLGLAGLAATYAPTLAALLETFSNLEQRESRWGRIVTQRNHSSMAWSLDFDEVLGTELRHHTSLLWVATMVSFGRLAIGERFQANRIALQGGGAFDRRTLEDYFRCPLTVGAGRSHIEIDNLFLFTRSQNSDPHLFDQLVFSATALKKREDGISIVETVDEIIGRGVFDLELVAAELGVTERTVQRRLKEQQTTFQDRLDTTRYKLAEIYLSVPGLTVEEISSRLGFSGDKAFRSAYRRWTGRSPRSID